MVKKNDPALLAAKAYANDLRVRLKAEWDATGYFPAREHHPAHQVAYNVHMLVERDLKPDAGPHITGHTIERLIGTYNGVNAFAEGNPAADTLAQYIAELTLVLKLPGRWNHDDDDRMNALAQRLGGLNPIPDMIR